MVFAVFPIAHQSHPEGEGFEKAEAGSGRFF
jgi:hypothetical protein